MEVLLSFHLLFLCRFCSGVLLFTRGKLQTTSAIYDRLEANCDKTASLSLEEVNELFGDEVVVNLSNASEEEKKNIDQAIEETERALTETF